MLSSSGFTQLVVVISNALANVLFYAIYPSVYFMGNFLRFVFNPS